MAEAIKPVSLPPSLRQRSHELGVRQQRFVKHGVVAGLAARPKQATHVVSDVRMVLRGSADVRRLSHQHIHNATVYNNTTGLPQEGGLMDPHLGAEGDVMCKTCGNGPRSGLCMGHHGHMDLQVLVLHPQYQKHIQKLLTCSCFACGTFLLKPEHRPLLAGKPFTVKLRIAADKCSRRAFCPNPDCCLPTQPVFKCDTRLSISATWNMKKKVPKETKMTDGVIRKLMNAGGRAAVKAEKKRQKLIRRQAKLFWDAEEKRVFAKKIKELDNLTIRRVLHMALSHTGPLSLRETVGLAPTLTADALVIDALCVSSKLVRPTRPNKRLPHDLTTRMRFVMAPSDNLVKLRRVREALANKEIKVTEARRLIKDTSSTPIQKVLDRLEAFNREDVATQTTNLYDETIVLKLQRTERGGNKSSVSGVKAFLAGKTKIVRAATRGGRVELSGRAALGPTPISWPVDVAGVPLWMATTLSRPEKVTRFNIEMLRKCVRAGWHTRNGANIVLSPTGEAVKLKKLNEEQRFELSKELGMGWTVHRCLRDGDRIMINRPPTLWCMNIMMFKIRIVETFTLQLCHLLAKHFNFDFDGDALIVHAVQSMMALASADLLSPLRYVINPTNGFPIMVPTLNTPMGIYLLTDGCMRVGRPLLMRLLDKAAHFVPDTVLRARLTPPRYVDSRDRPLWTGRQILSTILPEELFFGLRGALGRERAAWDQRRLDEVNDVVVIEAGQIVCGQWHGKRMFSGANTVTQVIERDFGCKEAANFLNATMAMATCFLEARGFSLSTNDFLQTDEMVGATRELRRRLRSAMAEVERIPGSVMQRESNRKSVANQFMVQSAALVQAFRQKDDMLLKMTESGAKGSDRHVAQMRFGLGQQLADGRRIEVHHDGTMRASLPCFHKFDTSADTRGFIGHGFGSVDVQAFRDKKGRVVGGGRCGLNPTEMYMLSAASKVAMAAKSINVPKSGALQNDLAHGGQYATVRGNQPCRMVFSDRPMDSDAAHDPSVSLKALPRPVRAMHHVLQFSFGGNAMDVTKTHQVKLRWLRKSNAELLVTFQKELGDATRDASLEECMKNWHATLVRFRTLLQGVGNAFELQKFDGGVQTTFPLAISMEREVLKLWHHAKAKHGAVPVLWGRATPRELEEHVRAMGTLGLSLVEKYLKPLQRIAQGNVGGERDEQHVLTTFQMLPHICDMLWHLRPWRLVGVDADFLAARMEAWLRQVENSLVDDGTAAGTLAVYAMGAAATQAELDKFHHVGEEDEASINMLQRTMELASARPTARGSQRTTLALAPHMTREEGEEWLKHFLYLCLDMLLLPHSQGGAQVLSLPEDNGLLTPPERRAWDTVWSLYGFPPPARTVLLLRVDRFACARRKITWKEVVRFVTQKMWRLGDAGNLLQGSLAPSMMGPDAETPLVISTRETDKDWSILVSCMEWTVLEELRAVLQIEGPLFDAADYDPKPGAEEQLLVGRLAMFLYSGQVMRGVQSIRSAKIETRPSFKFNAETGTVDATQRHFISIVGCVKPDIIARLDLQGIADFSNSIWNDIHVVFASLGVEAARTLWLQEMRDMVQGGVSMSHLELLASIVFSQGAPKSIVLKPHVSRDGFLSTSTAGHTMQVFAEAAISGVSDPLLGNASLFVGQPGTCGSRACEVVPTEEYKEAVRRDAVRNLEELWSAEKGEAEIAVPAVEEEEDVVVQVPRMDLAASRAEDGKDEEDIVVTMPSAPESPADGPDIVVMPPVSRHGPRAPRPTREGSSGALLPQGTSHHDFQQVGIQTVRVTKSVVPPALLPSGTTEGDFVFTGDRQAAERGSIEPRERQGAVSDVVRRMRGDVVPLAPSGEDEDFNSEAMLAETYQMFMNGYNLPEAVQQATHRGMTGIANPRSIRLAATSKRGARVTLRPTSDFSTQYGRSKVYQTTARERRKLAELNNAALRNMTADQRRAYLKEQKRQSNLKTAAAARRRRDMIKADLVGRGIAYQWHPLSPKRLSTAPTNATPQGVTRVQRPPQQPAPPPSSTSSARSSSPKKKPVRRRPIKKVRLF